MNDSELIGAWTALEPGARRRARIEARVFGWLEASETSLTAEWLGLLKGEPLAVLAYIPLGIAAMVVLTPVGWLAAWLVP